MTARDISLPAFLVGYPPLTPVTDAAPVADFDIGYHPPLIAKPIPASGAWREGDDPGERQFLDVGPMDLELGGRLPAVRLAFETWGELNDAGTNAVLLCHALTGDSHATSAEGTDGWWNDVVGPGKAIDTNRWFVVCPNVLGGCQGSTGPSSNAPDGQPWGSRFPEVTIRDMCAAEYRLAEQLGVRRWALVAGASFGGNRVMEWAASYPQMTGAIAVLVAGPATTAEQIAYQKTQNQAILFDPAFRGGDYYSLPDGAGPHRGLGLARELAHITYRCPTEFDQRFGRTPQEGEDPLAGGRYAVASYLDYHAYKLAVRFDANSYLRISQAMITHDIGRGRGGTAAVIAQLTMPALVVSVDSDRLFYPRDVEALATALPGSGPVRHVHSEYGHDGFLIENDQVTKILRGFLDDPSIFPDAATPHPCHDRG
ncbi:homoserine O-acetyltransferase MetX [Trueperella pecoris]|uniref:Homoserine O-acetyltransferase n=1 Tax=Trueperella pecoris TaxID=2733571 RepID=A0A7M1QVF9_9ACTO|nr:homoserine O-acetyltransferase [Trueperella pecoris]QOR45999.1 homoserine O-acetyltransferase [Trueperella pecoris]